MFKPILASLALAAAGAILLVLFVGSRQRALHTHCRNNLRHLGGSVVRLWKGLDPSRTGREFWQNLREVQYRIDAGRDKGQWKLPYSALPKEGGVMLPLDPFLCPVHGKTASNPASAGHIDFLGPRTLAQEETDLPKPGILGADRPGNHPSGGHVLRLDGSVEAVTPSIGAAGYEEAVKALKE